jgi:hypothetical protein
VEKLGYFDGFPVDVRTASVHVGSGFYFTRSQAVLVSVGFLGFPIWGYNTNTFERLGAVYFFFFFVAYFKTLSISQDYMNVRI